MRLARIQCDYKPVRREPEKVGTPAYQACATRVPVIVFAVLSTEFERLRLFFELGGLFFAVTARANSRPPRQTGGQAEFILRSPSHEDRYYGNCIAQPVCQDRGPQVTARHKVCAPEYQAGINGVHNANRAFVKVPEAE